VSCDDERLRALAALEAILFPFADRRFFVDPDVGRAPLPDADAYAREAEGRLGRALDRDAVAHVFALRPLTEDVVLRLNPDALLDPLAEDLEQLGYPKEDETGFLNEDLTTADTFVPTGETERHQEQVIYLREALRELIRRTGEATAKAGCYLTFLLDPADVTRRVVPDVFFVRGIHDPERPRRDFRLWEEGRAPELVIEVASDDTWTDDLGAKRDIYRDVFNAREYLIVDSDGLLEDGPIIAWRLSAGAYVRAGTSTRFQSQVAPATFQVIDGFVRLVDDRGQLVPGSHQERMDEHRRGALLEMLQSRFGTLPEALRGALATRTGGDLDAAFNAAVTAPSLDALLRALS
jgi:Uma2 family endonuclease